MYQTNKAGQHYPGLREFQNYISIYLKLLKHYMREYSFHLRFPEESNFDAPGQYLLYQYASKIHAGL